MERTTLSEADRSKDHVKSAVNGGCQAFSIPMEQEATDAAGWARNGLRLASQSLPNIVN
ncbi:MAG: hypothetical protein VKP70_00500 [Cyanobacteriota bacterium]|nr:hypothetical protein [Cyanobacteriota bacterium]